MKKSNTRSLFLFAALLLFSMMLLVGCSKNSPEKGKEKEKFDPDALPESVGLAYQVNEDEKTCTITGIGTCTDTQIVIPKEINGYIVTEIGVQAFKDCESITDLAMPDSVTKISYEAFLHCSKLKSLVLSNSLYDVAPDAFVLCDKLATTTHQKIVYLGSRDNPYLYAKGANAREITAANLHESTKLIGGYAFQYCEELTSVTIPNGVTRIGAHAFDGCKALTEITIPDSVIGIDGLAFAYCEALTNVTLPNSIEGIGYGAFGGCPNIVGTVYQNAKYLGNSQNPYFYLLQAVDQSITSVVVHEDTVFLEYNAFRNCTQLTSVTIPNSISYFAGTFKNCTSLTSITIPESVTQIFGATFENCTALTSVVIPNSVTEIDEYAFLECENLATVYYGGTLEEWERIVVLENHILDSHPTCYFYSSTQPTVSGNYWRYVDGIPTAW